MIDLDHHLKQGDDGSIKSNLIKFEDTKAQEISLKTGFKM
jgi:hypothetical protein